MKKMFSMLLVILVFTGCAFIFSGCETQHDGKKPDGKHVSPPPSLIIRGLDNLQDKLEELRRLVGAERLLEEDCFAATNGVFSRQEDLAAFVRLIDSLPLPVIQGIERKNITMSYYPETQSLAFSYSYTMEADSIVNWYMFGFVLDKEIVEKVRTEQVKNGDKQELGSIPQEKERITVMSREDFSELELDELYKHYVEFWIDIDGYLVKVVHRDDSKDINNIRVDEIFKDLKLSTLKELEASCND